MNPTVGKRIEVMVERELSSYPHTLRQALARELEIDARIRAIVRYLEDLELESVLLGSASPTPIESAPIEPTIPQPPECPPSAPGEPCNCEEVQALRRQLKDECERHDCALQHMQSILQADRQRVADVVAASRPFAVAGAPAEAMRTARTNLVAALSEYDDFIPF